METWVQYGVGVACWVIVILFAIQVGVWFALYRLFSSLMATVNDLRARFEPQIAKVQTTIGDIQQTVAHVTETTGRISTEVRAVSAALTTSAERISVVATDSAEEIKDLIRTTSAEVKALVSNTSTEVQDLVSTTSTEVRGIVTTSKERARGGLDRVDLMVERTTGRVEETGEYIQETVLTPVREVAAIVTGIKVGLETLFGYPERKQIDQAYQDEELFI